MFRGMDHVALAARDPRSLIEWYRQTLGFHLIWSNGKERPVALIGGPDGSTIEVMPDNGTAPVAHDLFDPGLRHLAFRVDDFEAAHEYLQAKGVVFTGETVEAAGGGRVASFTDPEGNVVQIVARPAGFRDP